MTIDRTTLAAVLTVAMLVPPWVATPASAAGARPPARTLPSAAMADPPGQPDLGVANRFVAGEGLPDWSRAGYLGGQVPSAGYVTGAAPCRIEPSRLASQFGVVPDDGVDDSAGLQQAIDTIRSDCSPTASHYRLSLIELPAGRLDVSRQISVDASFLLLKGQGSGTGGTRVVFRPDTNTRYDTLSSDGSRWEPTTMTWGSGNDTGRGGWIWPGRALFKVQNREVATRYADEWQSAPANRKDLFEGSVNQHWVSGIRVAARSADPGFSARAGQSVIQLVSNADMGKFSLGGHVWVGAANSIKFYEEQGLSYAEHGSMFENLHMRQQMFRVVGVSGSAKTITLDRPLEFDLPVDSVSDGSAPLLTETPFQSKVTPLKVVEGVGFEDFAFTQDMTGLPKVGGGSYALSPADAVHNYGNLAPEYAMHGVLFKWAANSWARGLNGTMTGSHPLVTEVARNLHIEGNTFDGAWNKGKGGNGYLRGSRVWDSLYAYNTSRNLRHFTFQWSASRNVAFRNDLDSDLNLHGGWERYNLFEGNTVRVPYEHRSGSCTANCGGEGGELDDGTWYPIWWGAGPKAIKWSGSTGPQNVFHGNILTKQATPGGPFAPYTPYSAASPGVPADAVHQFGSDPAHPARFRHLTQSGAVIPDWSGRETLDYSGGQGVVQLADRRRPSLFLHDAGQLDPRQDEAHKAATWNMQGAGSRADGSYDNKYTSGLLRLLRDAEVVALQEAGSPPGGAHHLADHPQLDFVRQDPQHGLFTPDVEEYRYGGTNSRPGGYLYWLWTDTNPEPAGRVNLAIATRERVDPAGIVVVASPLGGRPALGVTVGGTVFFSLHGWSPGGNDLPGLLEAIRVRMLTAGPNNTPRDWVAMGDFNRHPDNLAAVLDAAHFAVHTPAAATHPSTNPTALLDYAVVPRGVAAPRVTGSTVRTDVVLSDHLPVQFDLVLQAAAEPRPPVAEPPSGQGILLRSADTTNVVDIVHNGTSHFLVDSPYHSGFQQKWSLIRSGEHPGYYQIMNLLTGSLMGQAEGARDGWVVQWHQEALDQLWWPDPQEDGTWTLRNRVTDQLLTVVPELGLLAGRDPDGSARQRFFLQSEAEMTDLQEITHYPLEGTHDLVADVSGESTSVNTPIILYQETDGTNQRFIRIPAGSTGDTPCYYLVNGGRYLSSSATGNATFGAGVTLQDFRPDTDEYLWCVRQEGASFTLANRTEVNGVPTDLYLTEHGYGQQLTVDPSGPGPIQTWVWEAATS
ncbi:endonuclease/exonuclease/phosphatase family protein [Micromonospora sp. NPDC003816]|uniref:endonuclease/exonuclease/phosphatase family protein n=1 Tax=unclassified Micromonospora TaxID=2617518 RepID=UPI0036B2D253